MLACIRCYMLCVGAGILSRVQFPIRWPCTGKVDMDVCVHQLCFSHMNAFSWQLRHNLPPIWHLCSNEWGVRVTPAILSPLTGTLFLCKWISQQSSLLEEVCDSRGLQLGGDHSYLTPFLLWFKNNKWNLFSPCLSPGLKFSLESVLKVWRGFLL